VKFRFVDKILSFSISGSIQTEKAISFEEFSLLKIWGRKGTFPETLIFQFAVESAALFIAGSNGFETFGVLDHIDEAHFLKTTRPGDVLLGSIDLISDPDPTYDFKFKISVVEKEIAHGRFGLSPVPLPEYFEKETYTLMWKDKNAPPS
jgi:3-hydroxymyristoyl/3-hydroxydecanoyl-(acyl carrier protein) dehydratase